MSGQHAAAGSSRLGQLGMKHDELRDSQSRDLYRLASATLAVVVVSASKP
jgi:hypothetical protein